MTDNVNFRKLGLTTELLSSLTELGYESPTPIQEQSIPVLIEGEDLLAQAQTGTGKTAAFALPILSHIKTTQQYPQALIMAPTRELAIQVAEAFQRYARHIKDFHVAPIYGGQDFNIQLRALKRGAHVIVGTPGRIMDHLRRGTLLIDKLKTVVLDEADEMLKMGFIDDIGWILEQIPHKHQTALFSATIPTSIKQIANRYLNNPRKIHIKSTIATVDTIEQFYTRVTRNQKLDVLTRFLEIEDIQAAIIFTRTKNCCNELAERLQARGIAAAALNGDMNQSVREKTITKLKKGALDILIATDVAARGIDVERITHVINYDIPHDTESYIHRIGRTGRAGRKGKAILFVAPREHRMLNDIERAINKEIPLMDPPSIQQMKEKRNQQLAEKIANVVIKSKHLKSFQQMVDAIIDTRNIEPRDIAAALVYLMDQANPIPTVELEAADPEHTEKRNRGRRRRSNNATAPSGRGKSNSDNERHSSRKRDSSGKPKFGKKTEGKKSEDKKTSGKKKFSGASPLKKGSKKSAVKAKKGAKRRK